jgi:pimeloyl-ACP methyl ester carboxylesterase
VDAQLRPLACLQTTPAWDALDARPGRQFAVTALASGLMWANMLRPFQLGKARTSHDGPSSWIRESRVRLEHAVEMYRAVPDGELAVVPGTSHGLLVEKPDLCNRIILDFLEGEAVATLASIRRRRDPHSTEVP